MDPGVFDAETARFVFILGLVLSIWVYDRFQITTGSTIAPAYLALNLRNPAALAALACNALLAWWLVYRVLPRFVLQDGKQKFLTLIPISIALQILFQHLGGSFGDAWTTDLLVISIGYVIPGLLAHDLAQQGFRNTLLSLTGLTVVLGAIAYAVSCVVPQAPAISPDALYGTFTFELRWLQFAMLFSVLASITLAYSHGLKAGGFVGAAYVSLFLNRPAELLLFVGLTLATYLIVRHVLARWMIVFGRRKFAAMLLVAALLSWGTLLIREQWPGGADVPLSCSSFALISLTLTGLYANDAERVGLLRLLGGTVRSVLFTTSATLLVAEIVEGADASRLLWLSVATWASAGLIFGRPLMHRLSIAMKASAARGTVSAIPVMTESGATSRSGAGRLAFVSRQLGVALLLCLGAALVAAPLWRELPLRLNHLQQSRTPAALAESRTQPLALGVSVSKVGAAGLVGGRRTVRPSASGLPEGLFP